MDVYYKHVYYSIVFSAIKVKFVLVHQLNFNIHHVQRSLFYGNQSVTPDEVLL